MCVSSICGMWFRCGNVTKSFHTLHPRTHFLLYITVLEVLSAHCCSQMSGASCDDLHSTIFTTIRLNVDTSATEHLASQLHAIRFCEQNALGGLREVTILG